MVPSGETNLCEKHFWALRRFASRVDYLEEYPGSTKFWMPKSETMTAFLAFWLEKMARRLGKGQSIEICRIEGCINYLNTEKNPTSKVCPAHTDHFFKVWFGHKDPHHGGKWTKFDKAFKGCDPFNTPGIRYAKLLQKEIGYE